MRRSQKQRLTRDQQYRRPLSEAVVNFLDPYSEINYHILF